MPTCRFEFEALSSSFNEKKTKPILLGKANYLLVLFVSPPYKVNCPSPRFVVQCPFKGKYVHPYDSLSGH